MNFGGVVQRSLKMEEKKDQQLQINKDKEVKNTENLPAASAAPTKAGTATVTSQSGSIPENVTASADIPKDEETAKKPVDPFVISVPNIPTQEGPMGIRYDFNDGARILLPKGKWHVEIIDDESDNIIFACDADEGWVLSTKKYYIPFRIKVWIRGQADPVLDHTLDLKGKEVVIKFPVGTLGDIVGWMPYAEKFQKKHNCITECYMAKNLADLFAPQYPELFFTFPPAEAKFQKSYASYRIGLFFRGNTTDHQPVDFRQVGLHKTAGYILGVDPEEEAPRITLNYERKIKERYVCIAAKSSCQAKFWNNGFGWESVIKYLKGMGYRVLCIDKDPVVGHGFVWNRLPAGAEDFTGSLPLEERVALLQHADFFIGLSSGLTWLAWCAHIPIVMISGFTLPICEFKTPYRVFNTHGCTGCWDDVRLNFDHHDFFWCPRFKNTDRQYECSRLITGKQVIGHINRLMKDHNLEAPNKN
jgi:autotransporter strand-loop-strand O-heptosyltransferase